MLFRSSGTTITGISPALSANDVVEIIIHTPFSVVNALTTTIIDAKGDLIVGSSADNIGRLAVGTNNYILTADSTQTLGVKWAAAPNSETFNPLLLMGA